MAQRCALDHDAPVYRLIGRLEVPDREVKTDVPLCEKHAWSFHSHDPKAFDRADGTAERKAEVRHYAEDSRSVMKYPRQPKPEREPDEHGRSRGPSIGY